MQSISARWRNRQCSGSAGFEECTAGEGEVTCQPALIAACLAIAANLLGGCSDAPMTGAHENAAAPAEIGKRSSAHTGNANLGEHFASAALDDNGLGQIRGGLDAGPGVVMSFAFQEATYINGNLAQSIVVPTITVSPSTGTISTASTSSAGSALPPSGLGITAAPVAANSAVSSIVLSGTGPGAVQLQVSPPAPAIQSLMNSGLTSVVSTLGSGGITNVISNTASNQHVQQTITAQIGVTGLSQLLQQQGVLSSVMSRMTAANSQFR
jgi:hypothetical protein